MKPRRTLIALALLPLLWCILGPAPGFAQAPANLTTTRVIYNTRKAVVQPAGELKSQIDALDRELGDAMAAGRTGQARRLLAKGLVLLSGKPWTDALDYATSLVLRSDRVYVDPARPIVVWLTQIYPPSLVLKASPSARVALLRRPPAEAGRAGAARAAAAIPGAQGRALPPVVVRDMGTRDGVSRDLADAPFPIELDLAGLEDGMYRVRVEVLDGGAVLGARTFDVALHRGLDARLQRIEEAVAGAPAAYRAEALFPHDHIRNVHLGRIPMGAFNLAEALAQAERVLPAVKAGTDPFAGRTGDIKRHYLLQAAGEIMPYRVYVPSRYDGGRPYPLVIALHGLGGTEDAFFESYGRTLPRLAEEHGYLVAAPLGYRVDGGYGVGLSGMPRDATAGRAPHLSELDVMEVLARMKGFYRVDESRIYLMGHSMGAIGTWRLGAAHPDVWAALAPIAGTSAPSAVEKMRHIPQIVVHGNADLTVPVGGSRRMVEEMKRLGVDVQYIEVPGGDHMNVVAPNLPAIFRFFDAHRKKGPSSAELFEDAR